MPGSTLFQHNELQDDAIWFIERALDYLMLCLVQVEAYVQTDVLHPERSFTVVGFQTTVYVRT